jgi:hypothetical protein
MFALASFSPAGTGLLQVVLMIPFAGIALYLFVPRIFSRPYRGFSLVVIDSIAGTAAPKLTARWRLNVCFFLWWRQFLAGLFASVLAGPLNILLSIMGLHLERWVADLAGILVIGPILLKMLIGNEFGEFRIEARRGAHQASAGGPLGRRLVGVGIIFAALIGVYFYTRSKPSKGTQFTGVAIAPKGEIAEPASVLFDIKPATDPTLPGFELYDCTYRARGKTARFRLQFKQGGPLADDLPMARASGKFLAMPGSENAALLEDLLTALEAKRLPAGVVRVAELPFDAIVLGENQSRSSSGGFAENPTGDWRPVKIFFPKGGDDGELFLNFNRLQGKAEFSVKDPDYGDYLLAQLATVL